MPETDEDWMDTAPAEVVIGTQFAANYNGTCTVGWDAVHVGEMIQRTPDGFAHTSCLRAATRPVLWE